MYALQKSNAFSPPKFRKLTSLEGIMRRYHWQTDGQMYYAPHTAFCLYCVTNAWQQSKVTTMLYLHKSVWRCVALSGFQTNILKLFSSSAEVFTPLVCSCYVRTEVYKNFMFCWPCVSIYACKETNPMHYLSSVYSVTIPLHVSGLLVAHHQEVAMYIHVTTGTCCTP
jgi:hypothetical protein